MNNWIIFVNGELKCSPKAVHESPLVCRVFLSKVNQAEKWKWQKFKISSKYFYVNFQFMKWNHLYSDFDHCHHDDDHQHDITRQNLNPWQLMITTMICRIGNPFVTGYCVRHGHSVSQKTRCRKRLDKQTNKQKDFGLMSFFIKAVGHKQSQKHFFYFHHHRILNIMNAMIIL